MAKPPEKPAAKQPQRVKPVAGSVDIHDPLAVPALYATLTACMVTTTAVRISFGEGSPTGTRFHSSVAIDRHVARGLIKQLTAGLKAQEEESFEDDLVEGVFGDD